MSSAVEMQKKNTAMQRPPKLTTNINPERGHYPSEQYIPLDGVSLSSNHKKTMNFKLLKDLYKIHSESGFEGEIICFIYRWINDNIPTAIINMDWDTGNLYITKGKAKDYPCIVAHMDQVQKYHPVDFTPVETRDIIFGYSPKDKKQCGLGADDKNGVWIALKCLEKYNNIKVALFISEEIGCVGSGQAKMDFFDDVRFVIEPDRKGCNDMIVEISFTELCSRDFINDVDPQKYGYMPTSGMMTDVEELKTKGLKVSCMNMSCGYYEPHTDKEYTVKKDLLKALRFVEGIIENCTKVYPHEYTDMGGYYTCRGGYIWDDDYDEAFDLICDHLTYDPTLTPSDLHSMYHDFFPHLGLDDYASIVKDAQAYIKDELKPAV